MPETLLRTKLFVPPVRPNLVPRPRLIELLNQGLELGHKLSLISAPAGFGKTTLVTEWVAGSKRPVAWLSPDEADNDPIRFLTYLVAALQTIEENFAKKVMALLQSPQPPPTGSILTALLNEISTISDNIILVLDDYHIIDSEAVDASPTVDDALTLLLEHLPPQMHLVITTREDPDLPLPRLRVRGQVSELRAADLRFTPAEATGFFNQVMKLNLTEEEIIALETRTEGWIAGLQLAALSMRGHEDNAAFIQSFTGSHRFVLDYLVEEVLHQQSESVQSFLLRTSILDRLCGPLCDAVCFGEAPDISRRTAVRQEDAGPHPTSSNSGQETLEYLERANLFIVPLDNERRWYRYHHLFAELLRLRLGQSLPSHEERGVAELHERASVWYEDNGLELEAFHHAAAANDIKRTERLIEGAGVPLHYRGSALPVLHWLESLPTTVLDARPSLWVTYASALFFTGQHSAVEQKLQAAEACLASSAALRDAEVDDNTQDLVGRIASIRATLAVVQHDLETIITQSRLALEHLRPDNRLFRAAADYTLGVAYHLQGDRVAASQFFTEVLSLTESFQDSIYTIAAAISLGMVQATDNHLSLASKTFERAIQLAGDPPMLIACEAFLGLARINYQWNDLETAQQAGLQCAQLIQQMDNIDTSASYGVFLAHLRLARGDVLGAVSALDEAEAFARQHNFLFRLPDVVAAQIVTLIQQGDLVAAADLAEKYELPISQARVRLAQGDHSAALALLGPLHRQMEDMGWLDEQLKITILQALAHQAGGNKDEAVQHLGDALSLAEPGGFIRIFVDEGPPMAQLLSETAARGIMPGYCDKLLAVFEAEGQKIENESHLPPAQPLIDSLTKRELEILILIADGLKNKEIAEQLVISLNTVLYHIKNIYSKMGVSKRTQAIAKAREVGLI